MICLSVAKTLTRSSLFFFKLNNSAEIFCVFVEVFWHALRLELKLERFARNIRSVIALRCR